MFWLDFKKGGKDMLTPSQIREYREHEGLTLRAVEKYAGITAANIGQLERGERGINPENYKKVMDGIHKAILARQAE